MIVFVQVDLFYVHFRKISQILNIFNIFRLILTENLGFGESQSVLSCSVCLTCPWAIYKHNVDLNLNHNQPHPLTLPTVLVQPLATMRHTSMYMYSYHQQINWSRHVCKPKICISDDSCFHQAACHWAGEGGAIRSSGCRASYKSWEGKESCHYICMAKGLLFICTYIMDYISWLIFDKTMLSPPCLKWPLFPLTPTILHDADLMLPNEEQIQFKKYNPTIRTVTLLLDVPVRYYFYCYFYI